MELKLQPFIDAYIDKWLDVNATEIFKWEAIKHFKGTFFNEDIPFGERIKQSFSKHKRLLVAGKNYTPLAMLIDVYEGEPKATEKMINALFDESDPKNTLEKKFDAYRDDFNKAIEKLSAKGYRDWKGRKNLKSYQDIHAVSVYLTLCHPDKYYIYKWGVFKDFAEMVGYKINKGSSVNKCLEFYRLCEEVKEELITYLKGKSFIPFYKKWLKENGYTDAKFNLLTQDFIYAVAEYFNSKQSSKQKKKKIKLIKSSVKQIKVTEFQSVSEEISKTFKPVKNVDYARKDQLFRSLGLLGEKWVMAYEQQRLAKKGLACKVIHTSVEEGDGKGYDIESVEDDGKTPRYIEVKTTSGCVDQPFYYTDNELQFSDKSKEHYYVYRVYNFQGETKPANLLIIHGSMKELKGKPVNYKVSVKK